MTSRFIKNQKGQAILETVLLFSLVVGVWLAVSQGLARSGVFQNVFGEPWLRLKNTIEFGVPTANSNIGSQHPAHPKRHATRLAR